MGIPNRSPLKTSLNRVVPIMVLYYAGYLQDNIVTQKIVSHICIGNYKVGPLVFIDDIVEPNSRHTLKQSHVNELQFASKKRFEFSIAKCKVLAINYKYSIENTNIEATLME